MFFLINSLQSILPRGDIDEVKKRKRDMKEDCDKHGGWWVAEKIFEVSGPVAIQMANSCYVKAMDNGKFVLGPPHGDGEPPAPEEVSIMCYCQ